MEKRKLGIILATLLVASNVSASESNQKMKECLAITGYTPDKFDEFNFSKAAACHQNYVVKMNNEKIIELRKFLSENPWYKGRYWDWEKCASNSACIQNYQYRVW